MTSITKINIYVMQITHKNVQFFPIFVFLLQKSKSYFIAYFGKFL